MKTKILALIGIIAIAFVLAGCAQPQGEETITIGFSGPLSGELASWGEKERKGIEMAIEEINVLDGIQGKKVAVVFEDSQCNPNSAATNVQKLVAEGVQAIIGDTCSSATLAAAPIAENNKVVLITPISGADSISQAGDYIFRNFIPNSYYGIAAAQKINSMQNAEKIAVLYINNDSGVSWKNNFIANASKQIVFVEGYAAEETDFRTLLLKVKEASPGLVILAGYYPDGARILKQAKEAGIQSQFFGGGDAFDDPAFIEAAGDAAEGFVFLSVPTGTGSSFKEFQAKYKQKYNEEPSLFSTYAYDSAKAVLNAMHDCGLSSEEIKNCLYQTDFQGVTNRIRFDKNGDLIGGTTILKQVKNMQFIEYEGSQ